MWSTQIYAELRTSARRLLQRERRDHTLQPTALVHEAWLKIACRRDAAALPRNRFVALAMTTMRRVLLDSARRHRAAKRGGDSAALPESIVVDRPRTSGKSMLHEALQTLAAADPELARLVELRIGGHGVAAIGKQLGLSPRTVKRRWRFARAWLGRALRRQLQ